LPPGTALGFGESLRATMTLEVAGQSADPLTAPTQAHVTIVGSPLVTGVSPASVPAMGAGAYSNLATSSSQLWAGVMDVLASHGGELKKPLWVSPNNTLDLHALAWSNSTLVLPLPWFEIGMNAANGLDWTGMGFHRIVGQQLGHAWNGVKSVRFGGRASPVVVWISSSELMAIAPPGMGAAAEAHVETAG